MSKILVTGGRDYHDIAHVYEILDFYSSMDVAGPTMIIEGGATGADALASLWAYKRGMPHVRVNAQWNYYGKKAGHLRNGWMLLLAPDICIAFPGGTGTANMRKQAEEAGVTVINV